MSDEKHLWLVIYPSSNGMAELYNVGVFSACDDRSAEAAAREVFSTTAKLSAWRLDSLPSGWSWYI